MENVKYIDLNGLKLFASHLKEWLISQVYSFDFYKDLNDQIKTLETNVKELEDVINLLTKNSKLDSAQLDMFKLI